MTGVTRHGRLRVNLQMSIQRTKCRAGDVFSDANHGFRHPDGAGFQPHYADLVWPLVTDFLQRTV